MQLGFGADGVAFDQLFDQINAPARRVEFVAEYLVARAGSETKSAMHAIAQNAFSDLAVRSGFKRFG